jgi:hypothetical protein
MQAAKLASCIRMWRVSAKPWGSIDRETSPAGRPAHVDGRQRQGRRVRRPATRPSPDCSQFWGVSWLPSATAQLSCLLGLDPPAHGRCSVENWRSSPSITDSEHRITRLLASLGRWWSGGNVRHRWDYMTAIELRSIWMWRSTSLVDLLKKYLVSL